jgi:hypothetical protein
VIARRESVESSAEILAALGVGDSKEIDREEA